MSDNRQSLSDLGAALGQQRDAAVQQSDASADAYMAGTIEEPVQRAPLREQEIDARVALMRPASARMRSPACG